MSKSDAPSSRSQLSRYSLRTFLFFITAMAVWFGWVAYVGNSQRAVIRIVEESGGSIYYRFQDDDRDAEAPLRTWLADLIGEELVFAISGVYLEGDKVDDATAERLAPHLQRLRHLEWLEFRATQVTDVGMQKLTGLHQLERLFLRPTQDSGPIPITHRGLQSISELKGLKLLAVYDAKVTGPGFASLGKMSQLESLDLRDTDIDDASLQHLTSLRKFQQIFLWSADVTDDGIAHLAELPNLENVYLSGTELTDTGLQLLIANRKLRILDLSHTNVTDAGLAGLDQLEFLEELRLTGTRVSWDGIQPLAGLRNLRSLQLRSTRITEAALVELESWTQLTELAVSGDVTISAGAIAKLRAALPKCRVE